MGKVCALLFCWLKLKALLLLLSMTAALVLREEAPHPAKSTGCQPSLNALAVAASVATSNCDNGVLAASISISQPQQSTMQPCRHPILSGIP